MYNGLGLRTARGSGTNGYVQRNLSFAKPQTQNTFKYDQAPPKPTRKPNSDIMLHRSKRQIEVECLQYQEELESSEKYIDMRFYLSLRYSTKEITEKVDSFRKKQLAKLEELVKRKSEAVLKEEKETEMSRLKDAFGIKDDAVEGDAFKFESEKQRQERLAALEEKERLERKKRKRLCDR